MRVIRVFPRRTSMTPTDDYVFIGDPPLWRPEADEVHISVAFTWDIEEGRRLREAWANHHDVVKIGGPALGSTGSEFIPGCYVKHGVTFTTRGCPNRCPWCLVPELEGNLRLLPIKPGWIIQDNNLLAAPRKHKREVFAMLRTQRAVSFQGGLDARLLDPWTVEELRSLTVKQIFLAADTVAMLRPVERALKRLSFLPQYKLRVYTMIGYEGESMADAEARMEAVWQLGGMPFAQLYQPPDCYINYPREWKALARRWSRPAIMRSMHKGV